MILGVPILKHFRVSGLEQVSTPGPLALESDALLTVKTSPGFMTFWFEIGFCFQNKQCVS